MGCFGYICKGCNTPIRGDCWCGGESTVMIHVRNGKELGRVEGHYNEYGGVVEQKNIPEVDKFRGDSDSINGHKEICISELNLKNSYMKVKERRVYKGRQLDFYSYIGAIIAEEEEKNFEDIRKSKLYEYVEQEYKDAIDEAYINEKPHKAMAEFTIALDYIRYIKVPSMEKDFNNLPEVEVDNFSGIVAWHSLCYNKATEEEKNDLTPSDSDPNQSWGKVRKKYK